MSRAVWVVDSSALIQIKSFVPNTLRSPLFASLTTMVDEGRLVFPLQVLRELKRDTATYEDEACQWARTVGDHACRHIVPLDCVKDVLAVVPDVLDPMKDSPVEEADPYVLALAVLLRREDVDARVVVQEVKDSPKKLSLNTACGILGVPSVPLLGLLRTEGIKYEV